MQHDISATNPGQYMTEDMYDQAADLATDLLVGLGYEGDTSPDSFGENVSDTLQTALMIAFMRSEPLRRFAERSLARERTRLAAHLPLNAFNLTPGATFMEDGKAWIVLNVDRDVNNENVYVWVRRGDIGTEPGDEIETRTFTFDFCTQVALIGHCLRPTDPDDNDWGN